MLDATQISAQPEAAFRALSTRLFDHLRSGETLLLVFSGEDSDFIRFNKAKIRQSGHVSQRDLSLVLIFEGKQSTAHLSVSGRGEEDGAAAEELIAQMRSEFSALLPDPHLLYAHDIEALPKPAKTAEKAPPTDSILADILAAGQGLDLVGHLANGPMFRGFANSLGAFYWRQTNSFNFDWSCYLSGDKAVKNAYAGSSWSRHKLGDLMNQSRQQLETMARPAKTITPGTYRTYLAPAALGELLDLLSWSGFGIKAQKTGQSPLQKLSSGARGLHEHISICENNADGYAPPFSNMGFVKPDVVPLIKEGAIAGHLVSPRSAKEFDLPANCGYEAPQSLRMTGGSLAEGDVLAALDTGLYINNLWYCNYSDLNDCRITGMTRFACFWVEDGQITAPINVMRFDDSLYALLGSQLEDLTQTPKLLLDPATYGSRSVSSNALPGALISKMTFTL